MLTRKELNAQKHLSFQAICEQSKMVKFQPKMVVQHLLGVMQQHNRHNEQHVNWKKFSDQIVYLLPKTNQDKMTVFLRAIAPQELTEHDYLHHQFTREEIISLCREALHCMNTKDDFFEELTINFAKYIYQVLNLRWNENKTISIYEVQENFKKANEYDKRLLILLYGSVGIMSIDVGF